MPPPCRGPVATIVAYGIAACASAHRRPTDAPNGPSHVLLKAGGHWRHPAGSDAARPRRRLWAWSSPSGAAKGAAYDQACYGSFCASLDNEQKAGIQRARPRPRAGTQAASTRSVHLASEPFQSAWRARALDRRAEPVLGRSLARRVWKARIRGGRSKPPLQSRQWPVLLAARRDRALRA